MAYPKKQGFTYLRLVTVKYEPISVNYAYCKLDRSFLKQFNSAIKGPFLFTSKLWRDEFDKAVKQMEMINNCPIESSILEY